MNSWGKIFMSNELQMRIGWQKKNHWRCIKRDNKYKSSSAVGGRSITDSCWIRGWLIGRTIKKEDWIKKETSEVRRRRWNHLPQAPRRTYGSGPCSAAKMAPTSLSPIGGMSVLTWSVIGAIQYSWTELSANAHGKPRRNYVGYDVTRHQPIVSGMDHWLRKII